MITSISPGSLCCRGLACVLLLCCGCHASTIMRLAVPPSQLEHLERAARPDGGTVVMRAAGLNRVDVEDVLRVRVVSHDGSRVRVPLPFVAKRVGDRVLFFKTGGGHQQVKLKDMDYLLVDAQVPKPLHALDYLTISIIGGSSLLVILVVASAFMLLGDDEPRQTWDGK